MQEEDLPTILYEFVQPRTIDQSMLTKLIIDQGPKGEAGRLFLEDGIKLDEVKEIRMEFLNILKIDYLWVMPNLVKLKLCNNIIEKIENFELLVNLKELDLSFNNIRVMENLDNLPKLEILLLYNNEISVVKGLDNLQELMIFSIGNNCVEDKKHILYLRKLPKLRSLNASGNLCTEDSEYLDFVIALMPKLVYFEYKMITQEQRKSAMEKHARFLTVLEESEVKERAKLKEEQECERKLVYDTSKYVEYLDGNYLFEQMFEADEGGRALRMINEDAEVVFEEYEKSFVVMCKELYQTGLKEYDQIEQELEIFDKAVRDGKEATQNQGRAIVDDVLQHKALMFKQIKQMLKNLPNDMNTSTDENTTEEAQKFSEDFSNLITNAWTRLMSNEIALNQQIEDLNEVFRFNLLDLGDTFLSNAQGHFSLLRNRESEYNDAINSIILYYLTGFGDDSSLPESIANFCGDKDVLSNTLATSHELHLQVLDAREDLMVKRMKKWREAYVEQLALEESKRHNQQVLEIAHFADSQMEEFSSLQLMQQTSLNINDPEIIFALEPDTD